MKKIILSCKSKQLCELFLSVFKHIFGSREICFHFSKHTVNGQWDTFTQWQAFSHYRFKSFYHLFPHFQKFWRVKIQYILIIWGSRSLPDGSCQPGVIHVIFLCEWVSQWRSWALELERLNSSIPTITVTPRKWVLFNLWLVYLENSNGNTVYNLLFVLSFETGSYYGV